MKRSCPSGVIDLTGGDSSQDESDVKSPKKFKSDPIDLTSDNDFDNNIIKEPVEQASSSKDARKKIDSEKKPPLKYNQSKFKGLDKGAAPLDRRKHVINRDSPSSSQRRDNQNFSNGFSHENGDFNDFPSSEVFSHPSPAFRQPLRPDPDNFVPVAQRLSMPLNKEFAMAGAGVWSRLTRDILDQFTSKQQRLKTMQQKILLWKELYRVLRSEFDCGLFVFGSTFNGFGSDNSDVDMCLFPQGPARDDKSWLVETRKILKRKCGHFIRGNIELINAKVPILKFFDREGGIEVDVSVNNPVSIRNTHLLHSYAISDYRVRPLVLAVKLWAQNHGINEARFQTLSSYTLTLMVLNFLQVGVRPPVLPCLHRGYPAIFNSRSDFFNLPYTVPEWISQNNSSLGELFFGFFRWYGEDFNFSHDVGSVRCGSIMDASICERFARENKIGPGQWTARLLMEEPFDRTNAARAVCNDAKWNMVKRAFQATLKNMENGSPSSLSLSDASSRNVYQYVDQS